MNSTSGLSADRLLYVFCALVVLVLAVVICSGCQGGGMPSLPGMGGGNAEKKPITQSNSYAEDVTKLINEVTKEKGDVPAAASFRENRYSGIGVLEFQTTPGNVMVIANAFGMSEIPGVNTLESAHVDQNASGVARQFGREDLVRAYGIFGKPPNLKCPSGRQLEFMVIFYGPKTNEVCIETKQPVQ